MTIHRDNSGKGGGQSDPRPVAIYLEGTAYAGAKECISDSELSALIEALALADEPRSFVKSGKGHSDKPLALQSKSNWSR